MADTNYFTEYKTVDPFSSEYYLDNIVKPIRLPEMEIDNFNPYSRLEAAEQKVNDKKTNESWWKSGVNMSINSNNMANKETQKSTGKDTLSIAYNYFLDKGLTPEQAAGIVGNLGHESRGETDITEKSSSKELVVGSGKGYGLAQWTNRKRQQGLANFAKERGTKTSDLQTQLDYIWHELNTTEKNALTKLKQTNTVETATKSFMDNFERPGVKALDSRIKYAKKYLV